MQRSDATSEHSFHLSPTVKAAAGLGLAVTASCSGPDSESDSSGERAAQASVSKASIVAIAGKNKLDAARFLGQATNGASRADIDELDTIGIGAWLDLQFLKPRGQSHWDWLVGQNYHTTRSAPFSWDYSIWRQLIAEPDQLRQRVALALLDIFVISIDGIRSPWRHFGIAAYMDKLLDNAFGNFRNLLEDITYSPAMGEYLTFAGSMNQRRSGVMPDENYARELLQLFTIGLVKLNDDGTVQASSDGSPQPTYDQNDVSQLARVFTGFALDAPDGVTPEFWRRRMVILPNRNERGASTFLGTTVSGGGNIAVKAALDAIFQHPNVPPFFCKGLIQRLVTSNPSADYVGRIAAVFKDNGRGTRGDMRAVIRAILTDSEARSDAALDSMTAGKLRDPVQRLTNWARAFRVTSKTSTWKIEDMSSRFSGVGQSPGRSPSVFNFFRPGYSPINSPISQNGLCGPEFQITDECSVVSYTNFMYQTITKGLARNDVVPFYDDLLNKTATGRGLLAEVCLRLTCAPPPQASVEAMVAAIETLPATTRAEKYQRIRLAILLVMNCPTYLVQR